MSVERPGGDPNAQLYEQLKRDVLERLPQITSIEYVPDSVEARQLRATFDPDRLDPPTGPDTPILTIEWYREEPHDWFRIDFSDPNTGFHAGWHQDEDHPDLGPTHIQCTVDGGTERWETAIEHETPSRILWEVLDELLTTVRPEYQ